MREQVKIIGNMNLHEQQEIDFVNQLGEMYGDLIEAIYNNMLERAALIFNHVKSTMNWNEFYGYSCDVGVRKAYQDKVGNSAEINLMLTAMLRYAGIDANPVLISTRGNGISLSKLNNSFTLSIPFSK